MGQSGPSCWAWEGRRMNEEPPPTTPTISSSPTLRGSTLLRGTWLSPLSSLAFPWLLPCPQLLPPPAQTFPPWPSLPWTCLLDRAGCSPHLLPCWGRQALTEVLCSSVNLPFHLSLPYQTMEARTFPWSPSIPSNNKSLAHDRHSADVCMAQCSKRARKRINILAVNKR